MFESLAAPRRAAGLLLAVGCLDAAPVANRLPVDTAPIEEPPPPHQGFAPVAFQIAEAGFAIDHAAQVATGLTDRPIRLVVGIYDQDYLNTGDPTPTNHCTTVLQTPGPLPLAAWAETEGAWFAFEVPEAEVESDCSRLDFPPEWGDDPSAHVARWTWGAGINPLPADLASDLAIAWSDVWEVKEPWVVGAGYSWERLTELVDGDGSRHHDGYVERGWAFGWELEGNDLRLVDGERVPLDAERIAQGADGWFEATHVGLLEPASRLVEDP